MRSTPLESREDITGSLLSAFIKLSVSVSTYMFTERDSNGINGVYFCSVYQTFSKCLNLRHHGGYGPISDVYLIVW